MALVPATITVTFVANFGLHRVCYRINGIGAYTCQNVTCTGGGANCSTTIAITVDNETCTPVGFDGYAQAACEDIASLNGRVPFNVTFTPTPSCNKYTVTCNTAGVASVTLTNRGSGYGAAQGPPAVSFSGGGGTGAVAASTLGVGKILTTAITFTTLGTGGTAGTYTGVILTGGTGTGAQATIIVGVGGTVTSGTITAAGSGYLSTDVLTVPTLGGVPWVTSPTFAITSDSGTVTGVIVTAKGVGYVQTGLTVTIAAPASGVRALGTPVIDFCSDLVVPDCTGAVSGQTISGAIIPGGTVSVCKKGTVPVVPATYSIAANGNCLCACQSITITASGSPPGSVDYWYNACNGTERFGTIIAGGSPSSITICAVTGSVVTRPTSGITAVVTINGTCTA